MSMSLLSRRPGWVLVAGFLSILLALPLLLQLRLSTDLLALLPADAPAAEDYRLYLERFGGAEKVFVLLLPGDAAPEAQAWDAVLARAAAQLADVLAESPEVSSVRAGVEPEDERFFLDYVVPRAPLLLAEPGAASLDALARRLQPEAVRARVERLQAVLRTPTGAVEGLLARRDPLGFSDDLGLLQAPVAVPLDPLTSTFRSETGAAALLILTPSRAEIDPEAGRALQAAIDAGARDVRARLQEQTGAEVPLVVRAVGGALYASQDEALLRRDLQRTLTGSITASALILLLAFGGARLPILALSALALGLVWTGAVLQLLRVELAAVAIGFAAVLVGLGIDYGIHGCARFRAARDRGLTAAAALDDAFRHAGPAILTSALTTSAAFLVLSQAHLPPLRQVGLLVALGCVCILLAMATAGASALVLTSTEPVAGPGRRRAGRRVWAIMGRWVTAVPAFGARYPRTVLTLAGVLSAVALWGLGHVELDPDPRTLRPENHALFETEELLVQHFDVGLGTANVVLWGETRSAALQRAVAATEQLQLQLGPEARITSPAGYLLGETATGERLRRLAELPFDRAADELERELRAAGLNPRAFRTGIEALRALGAGRDPGAPPPDVWPDWLREAIVDDPAASSAGAPAGTWISLAVRLPEDRSIVPPPGTALASATALGDELRTLAGGDLRRLAGLALGAVSLLILLSFRGRLGPSLLTLLPVVAGSLWTLGLWAASGRTLDLFSLAVLPILLGIGLDDGLHVVHGARGLGTAGSRSLHDASVEAGHGLLLTTLTTCAGFASLVLSAIPGLRAGGLLIALGVFACWLCTVLLLPALEAVRGR